MRPYRRDTRCWPPSFQDGSRANGYSFCTYLLYLYIQVRKGEHFRKVPTGHVSSSWSRSSLLIISVALGHIPRSWSRPSLLVTSLALGHVPRSWSRPSLLVASLALGHVPRSWSRLRQVKARVCDNCSVSARFGPPGSARPVACARSRLRVPGPVSSGGTCPAGWMDGMRRPRLSPVADAVPLPGIGT